MVLLLLAGVVLLGRLDGKLELWDLLDRTHAPVVVAPVSPAAIKALAFSPGPGAEAGRSSSHQAGSRRAVPAVASGDCVPACTYESHLALCV